MQITFQGTMPARAGKIPVPQRKIPTKISTVINETASKKLPVMDRFLNLFRNKIVTEKILNPDGTYTVKGIYHNEPFCSWRKDFYKDSKIPHTEEKSGIGGKKISTTLRNEKGEITQKIRYQPSGEGIKDIIEFRYDRKIIKQYLPDSETPYLTTEICHDDRKILRQYMPDGEGINTTTEIRPDGVKQIQFHFPHHQKKS